MKDNVKLDSVGIRRLLTHYSFPEAVSEYIWNGIDANADKIYVNCEFSKAGTLKKLLVKDNGTGIKNDQLGNKFRPFFASEKRFEHTRESNKSKPHGRKGWGRLTFFKFANEVEWNTTYNLSGKKFNYKITMDAQDLGVYNSTEQKESQGSTGTTVTFSRFNNEMHNIKLLDDLTNYIKKEFGWYIELCYGRVEIYFNDALLNYKGIIADKVEESIKLEETREILRLKYIRWKDNLTNGYSSKIHYLNTQFLEKHKETTPLSNYKEDFPHSIYISNSYFDNFNFLIEKKDKQGSLIGGNKKDKLFKEIESKVKDFVKSRLSKLINKGSDLLIEKFEKRGILKTKDKVGFDLVQTEYLKSVTKEIYKISPELFSKLTDKQAITFLGLLDSILKSDDKPSIIEIMEQVVELDPTDRKELIEVLNYTTLTNITKMIKLVKDRYEVVSLLNQMVFKRDLKANEIDHLQKSIEVNYWIFGEQYNLVSKSEENMEKALRNYLYVLNEKDAKVYFESKDKKKRMDIFMCKQDISQDRIDNIVVELKHPEVTIGNEQLSQVVTYMNIIMKRQEFNSPSTYWDFMLIGNKYDSTIQSFIDSFKDQARGGLVFKGEHCRIFVKTWSQVFAEFKIKHDFLDKTLKLEKDKLAKDVKTAQEATKRAQASSASLKRGFHPLE